MTVKQAPLPSVKSLLWFVTIATLAGSDGNSTLFSMTCACGTCINGPVHIWTKRFCMLAHSHGHGLVDIECSIKGTLKTPNYQCHLVSHHCIPGEGISVHGLSLAIFWYGTTATSFLTCFSFSGRFLRLTMCNNVERTGTCVAWDVYSLIMEPLSFMCQCLKNRPGQAVVNSYTIQRLASCSPVVKLLRCIHGPDSYRPRCSQGLRTSLLLSAVCG